MMNTWWYGYWPYMGMGIFWFFLMVLFWIFVIWVVVWLVRGWGHNQFHYGHKRNSALSILEERYAKWEIDKKEFEEKMKDLKNNC